MKFRVLFLFIFISINCFSQGEASNWLFGNKAGIRFNEDNSITVLSVNPNPIGIDTSEGCSSISDANGNLLIYTDGRTVWDGNHRIMPNGNYNAGTGLLGDPSSTQSGIIVPHPANPNLYYIVTVDEPHHQNAETYPNQFPGPYDDQAPNNTIPLADDGFNNGLNYSIVDITAIGSNGSIGDIVSRNNPLITYDTDPNGEEIKYKCSEKITAVKNRNDDSYWVITHFVNKFYAFKIDENGIDTNPVVTTIDPLVPTSGYRRNSIGQLKVSPNGKKIAIAHNQLGIQTGQTANNGVLYLYDFDSQTGVVSNAIPVMTNISAYGVEFSSKTKKLYVSTESGVFQFDIEADNINATGIRISTRGYSSLQLAPNQKIYKANVNSDTNFLDVINFPELEGIDANFQPRAVSLGSGASRFGLPPFITSLFRATIEVNGSCLGIPVDFSLDVDGIVDSVSWDFGDGSLSSATLSPSHAYTLPGDYTVRVSVIIEGIPLNASANIKINPLPTATPANLIQCGSGNSSTNVSFDLAQANASLTNGDPNLTTSFFSSIDDANDNANALPLQYSNTSNGELIYVRVIDSRSGCFTITTLELFVNSPSTVTTSYKLEECDNDGLEDGFYRFNLSNIPIAQDFPIQAVIFYYAESHHALLEINALNNLYTNISPFAQTIFARVEIDNECQGIFPIDLIVNPLPQINTEDMDYVCTNLPNKFIRLDAGLLQGSASRFAYEWSTGATSPAIMVNQPGNYWVTVTNAQGCSKTRNITVLPSNNASIESIDIVDLTENNSVTVNLSGASLGDYLYSLDMPDGPFQESNFFDYVAPGFHTVYVHDTRGCGTVSQDIAILEIPKYFTPNGDGYNDRWKITGLRSDFSPNAKTYIFDRFGKLLADISPDGNGWDGNYNGQALPSTDYWYVLLLENGRTVKGHFSLKR